MRVLLVDIGNTTVDYLVLSGKEVIKKVPTKNFDKIYRKYRESKFYVSCVVEEIKRKYSKYENVKFVEYDDLKKFVKTGYNVKNLGVDRLLGIFASKMLFEKDVVVVSLGTCLVMDYIDSKGVFVGGEIFPGIRMVLEMLNKRTSKLPLVNFKLEDVIVGNDTEKCILSSVSNFYGSGIKNFISSLKPKTVIVSGGDARIVVELLSQMKLKVKLVVIENLVIYGLFRWYEMNKDLILS